MFILLNICYNEGSCVNATPCLPKSKSAKERMLSLTKAKIDDESQTVY